MADAREAALAVMTEALHFDRDHAEDALDALASSPEVRAALVVEVNRAVHSWMLRSPGDETALGVALVDAVLAVLAGTSGTEEG